MPNHVDQRMTITGPEDSVRAFVDIATGLIPDTGDPPGTLNYNADKDVKTVLSFHAIVPLPEEYHKVPYSDFDIPMDGNKMERVTWGVKWGAYNVVDPEVSPGRATYEFTCAWGPPGKFYEKASKRFSDLDFFISFGGEAPALAVFTSVTGSTYSKIVPSMTELTIRLRKTSPKRAFLTRMRTTRPTKKPKCATSCRTMSG